MDDIQVNNFFGFENNQSNKPQSQSMMDNIKVTPIIEDEPESQPEHQYEPQLQHVDEDIEVIPLGYKEPTEIDDGEYETLLEGLHNVPPTAEELEEMKEMEEAILEMKENYELNIRKIQQYFDSFPYLKKELKHVKITKLNNYDYEEIHDILYQCQLKVSNRNNNAIFSDMLFGNAMYGIENLACNLTKNTPIPLHVQGWALACKNNEIISDALKEMQIKYMSRLKVIQPEYRLLLGVLMTGIAIHTNNSAQIEMTKWKNNAKIDENTLNEYDDL